MPSRIRGLCHAARRREPRRIGRTASLVAEALFDRGVIRPLRRIGLPDRFIECGSVPHLHRYGLSTDRVVERWQLG
jgi:transketolase C-terminal domain/subunit